MLLKLNKYSYLVFALCFFAAAAIIENHLLKNHPENHLVQDFQEQLWQHEKALDAQVNSIANVIAQDSTDQDYFEMLKAGSQPLEKTGTAILIYKYGALQYWSDRSVAFYDQVAGFTSSDGLVLLPNGYYLGISKQVGQAKIMGLHLIKNDYQHENKYLKNTFFKTYNLPSDFRIIKQAKENSFPVVDATGSYLFSVQPMGRFLCTTNQLYIPGAIYLIGLLFLLLYFRREFKVSPAGFPLKLFALGAALVVVYWLHLIFGIPGVLSYLDFFSPEIFALNEWLPSLGDYFLLMLFGAFWLYNFSVDLDFEQLRENTLLPQNIIAVLLLLFAACLYLLANFFIEILIDNSTISFSFNRIIDISLQSVLGVFSVGLMLFSVVFFSIKIIEQSCAGFKMFQLLGILLGTVVFLAGFQLLAIGKVTFTVLAFFMAVNVLAALFGKKYFTKFALSYIIIFVSVASLYSLLIFYHTIGEKEKANQKLLAVNLVAERDPAAEEFLTKIQKQIAKDPAILSLLLQNQDPREYIELAYFNSYFRKYLFEIYICDSTDMLVVKPENQTVPCFSFMDALLSDMGMQIPGTDFYFMDNMNGRISYTGKFHYPLYNNGDGVTIYIDLDSDLLFEGIGFPELLIDKSMTRSESYRKFDYAKYYGGELTDRFGDYNYNFYIDTYRPGPEEFTYRKWDKHDHLIYHTRENNYVIVSRKTFTFIDYLISFPYIFVFYFIEVLIFILIGNKKIGSRRMVFDLKFRIQAAIISIVFMSLLLVAMATIYYNVEQYKSKHRDDLNEKMKSISEEIDMRLEDTDEITPELVGWLFRELAKLSNIFRTDINIYGVDGDLLASSRQEIFQRGLVSTRINTQAYYEIFQNFQYNNYFQPEKIGELSYLSAYKPIINNRGKYLGSINLPYFIKQDNYSQEITTFIVAFINLYVLLFLASIIVAVLLSNQITRPLVVIQENLQKMELGKRNEPIQYKRDDEIGSLVKEYNKKVDELSVSAELLARSERESAWREMAKQIAHEIKNPLTPMKLNIQYLQRTKGNNKEYNDYLERVTATLIEQIDNLSDIATEFSNFAKMPIARNQVFVLADQLQKVIDLYETHNRAQIVFDKHALENIEVNADREQLSRAIINLIKNGIQSIPDDRVGKVKITLQRRDHMAVIEVADNGTGIPTELQEKMFSPSFTTKTSGMGLGLSIVKNIVENFAGNIHFETKLNEGTTFFVEIPIYETQNET